MIRAFLLLLLLFTSFSTTAQIQVSKLVGKDSKQFKFGYGGFLKFAYPVSEAADISLEIGANIFQMKADPAYGWVTVPLKAGYRYTLDQTGTGFYVQPQLGYNIYGIDPLDNTYKGLIWAAGAGYLFPVSGKIQFDLGLLFESSQHKGGAANYVSLRLAHNFMIGKGNRDY